MWQYTMLQQRRDLPSCPIDLREGMAGHYVQIILQADLKLLITYDFHACPSIHRVAEHPYICAVIQDTIPDCR